jgi:hypothetical protein
MHPAFDPLAQAIRILALNLRDIQRKIDVSRKRPEDESGLYLRNVDGDSWEVYCDEHGEGIPAGSGQEEEFILQHQDCGLYEVDLGDEDDEVFKSPDGYAEEVFGPPNV